MQIIFQKLCYYFPLKSEFAFADYFGAERLGKNTQFHKF